LTELRPEAIHKHDYKPIYGLLRGEPYLRRWVFTPRKDEYKPITTNLAALLLYFMFALFKKNIQHNKKRKADLLLLCVFYRLVVFIFIFKL